MASEKRNINVPSIPTRLFEWYCGSTAAEDLLGDVEELFYEDVKTRSVRYARRKYWFRVLSLLFSYAVRRRKRLTTQPASSYNFGLMQNYIKIALRSMARQKTFSIINIVCLSVGMSVGLLALAAFVDITEADDFHTKRDRIYRIITHIDDKNDKNTYASSSAPLAAQLKGSVSGIDEMVQLNKRFSGEASLRENSAIPVSGYYATANFFRVFDFQLAHGNSANALAQPFTIILTRELSEKLFGKQNPVGKLIPVKGLGDFEVTGVLADYTRSHFLFESLVSFSTLEVLEQQGKLDQLNDWGPKTNFYTYLLLSPGNSPEKVEKVVKKISDQHFANDPNYTVEAKLQPMTSIPWTDHYNEIGLVWGFATMVVFFVLALLVLLPACFNYSNISIARAIRRAKEIGLRKVSGGQTQNIFLQMVMETIIISLISLGGGVLLFRVIRTEFLGMIVSGSKAFDFEITPFTFLVFLLFAIGTGILAGIFPATYFSRLNPIETLRNSSGSGKLSKISIRKGLIVFQFVITLVFILSVSILVRQYTYMLNYNMGFQKENILEIPLKGMNPELLRTELERLPEVRSVAMSSSIPGSWGATDTWVKTPANTDSLQVFQIFIDDRFIKCLEIELMAGADFVASQAVDEEYIIVNEAFLKEFSVEKSDALEASFLLNNGKTVRVRGVVKDFNFQPLRRKISPFFFRYNPGYFAYANVKIASNDITGTLLRMDAIWKQLSPDQTFESYFLDDYVEEMSVSIRSMIKIFGFLAALAITISCLGLLAVVISASEGRIKEMGLRKIMGANVLNLAYNLSRGFLKLIGIAILIATPLTYLFFDYFILRIEYYTASIGIWEMALGVLGLLIVVLITIGGQTLRIAKVNPVDTLKYE